MAEERPDILESLKGKTAEEAIRNFTTEPIDEVASYFILRELKPTLAEALQVDLTRLTELDLLYRWRNAMDCAINIRGSAGRGKSNMLLHYAMQWANITKKPFRLGSITYTLPEFNLALKGMKIRLLRGADGKPVLNTDGIQKINLEEFPLDAGTSISLDEAGDTLIAGMLSLSTALQTADIEARMRALQIGRFCAGVRELLHMAYWSIYALQRNPIRREVTGVVYTRNIDSHDPLYLGYVRIPYVDKRIFDAYNKPKIDSINAYGRSVGQNRIAQLINFFAEELWTKEDYQRLDIKPPSQRLNFLMRNPRYSIFPTEKYFAELEKLTRNKELHERLTVKKIYKPLSHKDFNGGGESEMEDEE